VDLLDTFLNTVRKYSLFEPGQRILISLSGGADSLVLFHLLLRIKDSWRLELEVFHLDHGLRPESSRQAREIEDMVRGKGLKFHARQADINALQEKQGGSLQEVAREERLRLLKSIALERSVDCIALGHQANDQAETLFLNLLRGAGTRGLAGILYRGQDRIVHPLLDIWRAEIEKYCRDWKLEVKEDPSNLSTLYRRNKVRLEVLPWLEKEFNPRLQESLWRAAKNLQEDHLFLEQISRQELEQNWCSRDAALDLKWLRKLAAPLRKRVLLGACRKIVPGRSFYFEHLDLLEDLLHSGQSGTRLDLPGVSIEKGYRNLYFFPSGEQPEQESYCYFLTIPGRVTVTEAGISISARLLEETTPDFKEKNRVYLDADKVGEELMVRNRRPGDRFWPRGSPGQKKLKDFFIDSKIDRWRRREIPLVVTTDGHIVWVVGARVSERFRARPGSKNLLEIKYEKLEEEKNGAGFKEDFN